MTRLAFRNSFDYIRAATFFDALAPASKGAILDIILEDDFQGATDPQALGLVYSLLANNNISSVLQLGTWMGFSTIVFGDALNRSSAINKRRVAFDTVEADFNIHNRARAFIERAGLNDIVRCIDGSSLSADVQKKLHPQYDLVYIDSSHTYKGTREEIKLYYPRVKAGGYILFHDTSEFAAKWDPSGEGGVRRAIDEWLGSESHPERFFFFEKPLWQSDCGLFLAQRNG